VQSVPFNKANVGLVEVELITEAISSGNTSGDGPFGRKTELELASRLSVNKALLTTSCTHALELAALLANLEPGDEVIVPSFTFVSTASAFAMFHARPVFVDSAPDTLNIDASLIESAVTSRTRAICVVHYGGVACDMDRITAIAKANDLLLIEDNAHGLFSTFRSQYLGTFGSLATMSFHETKNITCGEGGALAINDPQYAERAEVLREKGTNRSQFLRGQVDKYTWVDVGSSWVLSDILAAALWGQLRRVDEINQARLTIWNNYQTELLDWAGEHAIRLPIIPEGSSHVGHLFHMRFSSGDQRSRFIEHMKSRSVECVFHYQPLHLSPVGRRFGGFHGQCPVSEDAGDCLVRLPIFGEMTESQQLKVIEAVQEFIP